MVVNVDEGVKRISKLLLVIIWIAYVLGFISIILQFTGNAIVSDSKNTASHFISLTSYATGGILLHLFLTKSISIVARIGYFLYSATLIVSGIVGVMGNVDFFIPFVVLCIFSTLIMFSILILKWIANGFKLKT